MSMNDMKEKYEEMKRMTVCCHRFYNLKDHYQRLLYLAKTMKNINNVNRDQVNSIIGFLETYSSDMQHNTPSGQIFKDKHISNFLRSMDVRLELISEILTRDDDDEW